MSLPLIQSGGGGGGTTVNTKAKVTSNWLDSFTAGTGNFTASQPAASDLSVAALANGITATTQASLDNSTKLATTAYTDSAVSAGFPINQPGWFAPTFATLGVSGAINGGAANTVGANHVYAARIILPFKMSISRATLNVATLVAAATANAAIYTINGNTKLIDFSFSVASAVVVTSTVTPVVIQPGEYWFAWSSSDTATYRYWGMTYNNGAISIVNKTNLHLVNATNSTSGTTMPATLGALSAASQVSIPLVFFEQS